MEKEEGDGNQYTTHFRQYDSRIGRWLSVDPMMASFADQSPYNFVFNRPTVSTDVNGDCPDGDCDDVKGPDGNTYSVPSASADGRTMNDDGSVQSFSDGGLTYGWNEEMGQYTYHSQILDKAVGYNATPGKENGAWKTRSNSASPLGVEMEGGRPNLSFTSPTGRRMGDNVEGGWGEFGNPENLAGAMGHDFQGLLDDMEEHYTGQRLQRFGFPDIQQVLGEELTYSIASLGVGYVAVRGLGYFAKANRLYSRLPRGGRAFAQYKRARGGTQTLGFIETSAYSQRVSTEFHHVFFTQRFQRAHNLPEWLVNNRLNVWKVNTIQHAIIDPHRFRLLKRGLKPEVGWFKKYNWFTRF